MISNIDTKNTLGLTFRNNSYIGHQEVFMPEDWKNKEQTLYTLIFVGEELTPEDYQYFYESAYRLNLSNPRIFSPATIELASVFHPAFFFALLRREEEEPSKLSLFLSDLTCQKINIPVSKQLNAGTTLYYLQSLIFLSGVTLSAALIQNRWSQGTIESKLNRLWQAAHMLKNNSRIKTGSSQIQQFVLKMATNLPESPLYVLKQIKLFYAKLLTELVKKIPSDTKIMRKVALSKAQKERFGFVEQLKETLKNNLQAVILYGSATNSENFSDYDLIVVVNNLDDAIEALCGKSPVYNNIELNISLYGTTDFRTYQLASGDNLFDHGICLYGEIEVPHKAKNDLLVRNFSFGFIRYRQLMGMGPYVKNIDEKNDDKRNLLDYFIKIPLNIAKGIEGSIGEISTNELIKTWAAETMNFDVESLKMRSREGDHLQAISNATWAATEVLNLYNQKLGIITPNKKEATYNL